MFNPVLNMGLLSNNDRLHFIPANARWTRANMGFVNYLVAGLP
jgi:hypothetical protein